MARNLAALDEKQAPDSASLPAKPLLAIAKDDDKQRQALKIQADRA